MILLFWACSVAEKEAQTDHLNEAFVDLDGDGFSVEEDCDDAHAENAPDAEEVCDGTDNDCDGLIDEGVTVLFYEDSDGDGFGDEHSFIEGCEALDGYIPIGNDCDDVEPLINPAAEEVCNGVDDNCDGETDDLGLGTWYPDLDGDGYGDENLSIQGCSPDETYVEQGGDCDDSIESGVFIFPGQEEICDEVDNDCDGEVDEGIGTIFFFDGDGDGFGSENVVQQSCFAPESYVAQPGDCDDFEMAVSPSALEICNGVDDNCDGLIDDSSSSDASVWYQDLDGDGYGAEQNTLLSCSAPNGYLSSAGDCDDFDMEISPLAVEICNGIDDNCDGLIDDSSSSDASVWYQDSDGDGYGLPSLSSTSCDQPLGYVDNFEDCNDEDALVFPLANELCNGVDDNCSGEEDEGLSTYAWFADFDLDGFGDPQNVQMSCLQPEGMISNGGDCNDMQGIGALINPDSDELCDGLDNDCDEMVDESSAIDASQWYFDGDEDGYGDPAEMALSCTKPLFYVANFEDCNDQDVLISPEGLEQCNGVDDNCDQNIDEALLGTGPDCAALSCLELHNVQPGWSSGEYYINFSSGPDLAECDMTTDGGGWTLIFEDDFNAGVQPGWNFTGRYSCGVWGPILGGYDQISGGELSNLLSLRGVIHTELRLNLLYMSLDSWDGETGYVQIDENSVWTDAINNHNSQFGEVCGWNRGYYGSFDTKRTVDATVSHNSDTALIVAGSTLNQAPNDESFGIDDVTVWIR